MSNTYFRFKQFTIHQQHCAMKVCTDACILGAIANAAQAATLLDIGTGTGLLALMMGQRYPMLQIDTIEIDTAAANQAKDNFKESPWQNRMNNIKGDIKQYLSLLNKKYDHIICNPPFYDEHLKPADKANATARHSEQLTLKELADIVNHLLSQEGKFSVLLPPDSMKELELLLNSKNLFLNKQLNVKDRKEFPVIRVISEVSFTKSGPLISDLVIKKDNVHYTDEFKNLLSDFYLAF